VSLDDVGYKDYGDVVLPQGDAEKSIEVLRLVIENLRKEHRGLLLILGGEHLVTYPAVLALKDSIDTLVVFDAHLDARREYLGSKVNHATFLRILLERGIRVVHIGSRAYSKEELEFVREGRANLEVYDVTRVMRKDFDLKDLGRVYISIDFDVFDPSLAPGVSNPEPFGLSLASFGEVLTRIYEKASDVVAIDIVEVNPVVDCGDVTSILAAKVAIECVGLYLKRRGWMGLA